MKSTDDKPLEFFEYIVSKVSLSKEIDKQLSFFDGQGVHLINPETIGFMEQNEFGEFEKQEIKIESLITQLLYNEFKKSKTHLYNFSTHNPKEVVINYFRIQFNIIQNIIKEQNEFLNEHKYFLLPLRGLVKYINNVLSFPDMQQFELDESYISGISQSIEDVSFDSVQQTDNELISSIFSFMNGFNEKREQILNDEDFALLIKYTKELVETQQLPEIERKLEPSISNGLILHSYWVLHKELYTTYRIKSYFYDFIKSVFVNFSENDISSIKSQFGSKSRVKSDNFLPQIILDNL